MNKQIKKHIVFLLLLPMFGCSHIPSHVWYRSADELVANQQFSKAIEQLSLENNPSNALKIKNIQVAADKHAQQKIAQIKQLNANNNWRESLLIIQKLYEQVPNHTVILQIENTTSQQMQAALRLIDTQVAIEQAQLLQLKIKQLQVQKNSDMAASELNKIEQQINQETTVLAKQLIELAILAIAHSDYDYAAKTYALATRFNPTLGKEKLNQTINRGLSQNRTRSIQTRQANLINKLNQALLDHNVDDVIATEHILSKPPFQGRAVSNALTEVKNYRQQRGQYFDVIADSQYRNGQLQDAINNWKNALELTPADGQIKNKLQRAQNVFNKMQLLRTDSQP